jgi:hypothetical protein
MHAPCGSRGYHQIPCGLENPARAQGLPEGDIELAAWRSATYQAGHNHTLTHSFHYPMPFRSS